MTDIDTSANPINTFRLKAWRNGYTPLPVNGKAPFRPKWQDGFDLNEAYILGWDRNWPGTNTGILTRNTPCLDLDITDNDASEAAEAVVMDTFDGATILTRFGNPPKRCIPFQTDKPFTKIVAEFTNGQRIEFLGDGQQFVAHGTHPDAKRPYEWANGRSPANTPHDDLPGIDETAAKLLVSAIVARLETEFGYRLKGGNAAATGNATAADTTPTWECDFANHDDCVRYAMDLLRAGLNDGAAVNNMRALIRRYGGDDPDRMMRRLFEVRAMVQSARAKLGESAQPTMLDWINPTQWAGVDPPQQQWTVRDLIPARQVALFTGHGGAGKSTIGLHLAAAHALNGRAWLNYDPAPGPAFFIDAEEDRDTIQRRLRAVCSLYECSEADLKDLHILSLAGKGAALAIANRTKMEPTPTYRLLLERAATIKPEQIIIASSANVFYGNEIDRSQVTQFIDLLTNLAIAAGGSVILIAHPSLTGRESGSGISGSTAWHNAVRALLYLTSPKGEGDEGDIRKLEFKKNQYGPASATLTLRYRNGLFLPEGNGGSFDKIARDAQVDNAFVAILRRFGDTRVVSPNKSPAYAPPVMVREPEATAIAATRDEMESSMIRLLAAQPPQIVVRSFGPPSKQRSRIVWVGTASN